MDKSTPPPSLPHLSAPPPDYDPAPPSLPDPDEILPPAILTLHGRFIYPVQPCGTPSSNPLYQLSRAIHAQGRATESIDFQRLDYRVHNSDGLVGPSVTHRARDVYTLLHRPPMFDYVPLDARIAPPTTNLKRNMGQLKVLVSLWAPYLPGKKKFRVVRVPSEDDQAIWRLRGDKEKLKEKNWETVFQLSREHDKEWCWHDSEGRLLARQMEQVRKAGETEETEQEHQLRILVPLPRKEMDALVALWCLWMWHLHVEATPVKKTLDDGKCWHQDQVIIWG